MSKEADADWEWEPQPTPPFADAEARAQALDTSRSFLVQAPAGSGKTELLIQRFLNLLAEVDEPEQILAITFTLAATAEMRTRVLDALEEARSRDANPNQSEPCPGSLAAIASAAFRNDDAHGWKLLEQPQRLNIQTIDSLCLSIAHKTPLLSRLDSSLTPTEDAEPLYTLAARRTLARLGGDRENLSQAIRALLEARDVSLKDCERLIAGMLEHRDQWGSILSLGGEPDWAEARRSLEAPFSRECNRITRRASALLASDPYRAEELLELVEYACGNLENSNPASPMNCLKGVSSIGDLDGEQWGCLAQLLLTDEGGWRKRVDQRLGFPPGKPGSEQAEAKQRWAALIAAMEASEALDRTDRKDGARHLLTAIREMPPAEYPVEQWELLQQILLILRYAAAELRVIFAEKGVVDFVEIGLCARQALRGDGESGLPPAGLWRHLLVDEFQDTSRGQYELLALLADHIAAQWENPGEGTCFLVGDPMQSIYGFRQAEVELFERTRRYGLGNALRFNPLKLEPLVLRTNFRSHAGLVDRLNSIFSKIFSPASEHGRDAELCQEPYEVAFTPSVASQPAPPGGESVHFGIGFLSQHADQQERDARTQEEAEKALRAIQKSIGTNIGTEIETAIEAGQDEEGFRIGVLVRAKTHLIAIAQKLREAGILYRAIELEDLRDRQEVLDVASLTRALFHPMDRVAWLSVLRAPWCGLTLDDLHMLCGRDNPELARQPVLQLLRMRIPLLSAEGRKRAERVAQVLEDGLRGKQRQPFLAGWVERVWRSLGGRECVDAAAYENVRAFFRMLDGLSPESGGLEQQFQRIFAEPDPRTSERNGLHLMTIHKAKGLSFDVVIVPGLERETRERDRPLLQWLERTMLEGPEEGEFLIAPIGRKGGDAEPLYRWIEQQKRRRESEESKRLFYVACTRAKQELHLLGSARVRIQADGSESIEPGRGQSLLRTAWPALEKILEATREEELRPGPAIPSTQLSLSGWEANTVSRHWGEKKLRLRRLPAGWEPAWARSREPGTETMAEAGTGGGPDGEPGGEPGDVGMATGVAADGRRFMRPAGPVGGSLKARALGLTVHALFEELAASLTTTSADEMRSRVGGWRPRAVTLLRQAGLPREEAEKQAGQVLEALDSALSDGAGQWILGSRSEAETESSWTAWDADREGRSAAPDTLRADRIFRAGAEPRSREETHLWVIDYKTARHGREGLESFLEEERRKYQSQLEAYGRVMRQAWNLPLRLALYYPLLKRLTWWGEEGS